MDDPDQNRRRAWLVCILLAAAIFAAYGQLWNADFITYDDNVYVSNNPHVKNGLTFQNFVWAWSTFYADNWHPLTWLSHMLDAQIYGLNAGGHHLTSVLLHAANSILLFLLLIRMTKEFWPSAVVAGLFALHPQHVESVAWVSERKDVLSALFFILSVWAYAAWVENPHAKRAYVLSIILYVAGLLAKPMLVTLPFVLLLLDYWPLRRGPISLKRKIAEKTPFFALTVISCVVTFLAQRAGGAVVPLQARPLWDRLANVPVAYIRYVAKFFWPAHLVIPYPEVHWPAWLVALAVLLLLGITAWVMARRSAEPWLPMGWFWFLGTLVPVIGILQVGLQSIADRYTYIPSIGFFVMVIWTARSWSVRLAPLALGACFVLTAHQTAIWKNNGTLFAHSARLSPDNFVAYEQLGTYEASQGQTNQGLADLETSLKINPRYFLAAEDLGKMYLRLGKTDEAIARLRDVVARAPNWAEAHYDLGYAFLDKGRVADALDQFQAEVNLEPNDYKAELNMGTVLADHGLANDAIPYLQKAAQLQPRQAEARAALGRAFYQTGNVQEAISQYEKAIQLDPEDFRGMNDLAWILACNSDGSLRNGIRAVELARAANERDQGQNPVVLGTLAAALAETGDFGGAVATSRRAIDLAQARTNAALVEILARRLKAYEAGSPWRDVK